MTARKTTPGRDHATRKQLAPRTVRIRQKQADAVRLRRFGNSYDQIATELGYRDRGSARRAVIAGLGDLGRDDAEALVVIEDERLDLALQTAFAVMRSEVQVGLPEGMDDAEGGKWVRAMLGMIGENTEQQLKAAALVVKVGESRRRLFGLDAPVRTDITGAGLTVLVDPALITPSMARPVDGTP